MLGNKYTGNKKEKYDYTLFWKNGEIEYLEKINFINKYFREFEDKSKLM